MQHLARWHYVASNSWAKFIPLLLCQHSVNMCCLLRCALALGFAILICATVAGNGEMYFFTHDWKSECARLRHLLWQCLIERGMFTGSKIRVNLPLKCWGGGSDSFSRQEIHLRDREIFSNLNWTRSFWAPERHAVCNPTCWPLHQIGFKHGTLSGGLKPDSWFCVGGSRSLRWKQRKWPTPLRAFIPLRQYVCVALQFGSKNATMLTRCVFHYHKKMASAAEWIVSELWLINMKYD